MKYTQKQQQGFTLIELMVALAIIGLLASLILVYLGETRGKARDAKRLQEIAQLRSGVELYYGIAGGYPDIATWNDAYASGEQLSCDGNSFVRIVDDPLGLPYSYTGYGIEETGCGSDKIWSSYELQFTTEGATYLGPPGNYYLTPYGFTTSTQVTP